MKLFLLAGESSGDAIGAELMEALSAAAPGRLEFLGIGGPAMAAAGQRQMESMDALKVMGFSGVLAAYPRLRRLCAAAVAEVRRTGPAALITIDSPDFNIHVSRRLEDMARAGGLKRIHYVCPSVWGWRPRRARDFARHYELLLSVLGFEAPYFTRHGGRVAFIGHPAAWRGRQALAEARAALSPEAALARLGLDAPGAPGAQGAQGAPGAPGAQQGRAGARPKVLLLLPGSRPAELERNLPLMRAAVEALRARSDAPPLRFVSAVQPAFAEPLRRAFAELPLAVVADNGPDKWQAFRLADAALAVSGTVALELAAMEVPTAVLYRTGSLNYHLVRLLLRERMRRLQLFSLPNIIAGERLLPEHMRRPIKPDAIASDLARMLVDEAEAAALRGRLAAVAEESVMSAAPAALAAAEILSLLGEDPALAGALGAAGASGAAA